MGYYIRYEGDNKGTTPNLRSQTGLDGFIYDVSGFTGGTEYILNVDVHTNPDSFDVSNKVYFYMPTAAPVKPTQIKIDQISDWDLKLSWNVTEENFDQMLYGV